MNSMEIRKKFIEFFKDKEHTFVRSASVAPLDDPTLLFTNAGMNQFKDVFLGEGKRDYTRAVNSQKCIRVSGKHNDLEEVGRDGYHHTFFEMLGSWSFGDYYKKDAIAWAWELFTKVWKFDKKKLYATVYKDDDEAFTIWKTETDVDKKHILRFGEKDNFWEMGETGPCGPCSEIHIDLGEAACDCGDPKKCAVNSGCARYRELWNLVFIQYNRDKTGKLTELPNKHVDTGAGLERITALIQGVESNYDTDLFMPIISKIAELSGKKYKSSDKDSSTAYRVIADHVRMVVFSIIDGAVPSNEGRGYVVRRILRRGLRFGRKLGLQDPFMYKLVDILIEIMGDVYPELSEKKEYTKKIIEAEERSFNRTLDRGLDLFNEAVSKIREVKEKVFPGDVAFKLYDTYGFPIDLTQLMAEEKEMYVDIAEFERLMSEQKERARAAGIANVKKGVGGEVIIEEEDPQKAKAMACNHTATHLLHAALQQVLGTHATQKGSQVTPQGLRFDFAHFEAMTDEQIKDAEKIVNEEIKRETNLTIEEKSYDKAKEEGAMSLFGEKYGDKVRVVSIGVFSKELCGGKHVDNTKDIQIFKIVREMAISAGTRRIEAVTGEQVADYYKRQEDNVNKLLITDAHKNEKIKISKLSLDIPKNLAHINILNIDKQVALKLKEIEEQKEVMKKKERESMKLKQQEALNKTDEYLGKKVMIGGYETVIHNLGSIDPNTIKIVGNNVINGLSSDKKIVYLAGKNDGKVVLFCQFSKEAIGDDFNANIFIKNTAPICGGKGGGKPEVAQAGGQDVSKIESVLKKVHELIKTKS